MISKYDTQTNDQDLQELISSSDLPLLVVFDSPVCGPSHLMESVLADVGTKLNEKLRIVKIDSEIYSDLASQYQVHPLPALLLFKNGQLIERIEEEQPEKLISADSLIKRLQPLL